MATRTMSPGARGVQEIRRQWADPLSRNGYALVANTGATGLSGLLYWVLVARLYPTNTVGHASAAYAAMNLLAGFTALNFNGALTRFLPQAGRHTGKLIKHSYLVSAVASVLVTIPFLLSIHLWGPSYSELANPITGLFFIGCVVCWAIFTLQDSVLAGLRSATWVLLENSIFGIAKVILLIIFASRLTHLGIYLSWMIPCVLTVPLINSLIFSHLVPRHTAATIDVEPPTNRQIGRFLAGDYSGAMFLLATSNLVPVLVAAMISDVKNTAYFYMAWLVGGILDLVAVNMAISLTVEGSFNASTLAHQCRRALQKLGLIIVPTATLIALLAPWGLGLFGPAYAAVGAPILQLLALATLPKTLTEVYLGALRAQSRTRMVAIVQGIRAVLMLGLTVWLVETMGLIGAGVAAVVTQVVVAAMISPGLWRVLTADRAPATEPTLDALAAEADAALEASAPVTAETGTAQGHSLPARLPRAGLAGGSGGSSTRASTVSWRLPGWPAVLVGLLAAAGFVLFFGSLRHVRLGQMNGLGLLSVLPHRALAGVTLLALAFVAGLALRRVHPVLLGAALVGLVICLDGVTSFIEPTARFATSYQIAGYVQYITATGKAAPDLAAYFSWPGFFALLSFIRSVAGLHSVLDLMRFWPMIIDLLTLPAFFLLMRNLRISWRAKWLAGFLLVVGNWVGQDYFSPQSLNYVLYLVFLAILVNWFTDPGLSRGTQDRPGGLNRVHRFVFGRLEPGEEGPRPASTGQRVFLLALLLAVFLVSVMSHQLTPFYMTGACLALVLIRRCQLSGLWILCAVLVATWLSFAAVDYWSGHLSNIFGGVGNLGGNLTSSVGGRLAGSTSTHLLTLHARVGVAGAIVGLAVLGLLRRRLRGFDDRVLIALFILPMLTVGLQSYGGEIALRIYLFLLPPACVLAACFFFPNPVAARAGWRLFPVLALCAVILPVSFILVRYGNEAFERVPPGELAATDWVYAHNTHPVRLLWLSSSTTTDVTPEMPWAYQNINRVLYVPIQAPRNPAAVKDVWYELHNAGPDSYLLETRTQDTYLQQSAGYPAGWEDTFRQHFSAEPKVKVVFTSSDAVIYKVHWPRKAKPYPLPPNGSGHASYPALLGAAELLVVLATILVLAAREFARIGGPAARQLVRPLTLASYPLLFLTLAVVVVRFALLPSIHGGLL